MIAMVLSAVFAKVSMSRYKPDAELPSNTKVDTISTELRGSNDEFQTTHRDAIAKEDTTTHRDADQEGVEI